MVGYDDAMMRYYDDAMMRYYDGLNMGHIDIRMIAVQEINKQITSR